MLIGREEPPFDSPDYLYELKLDGVRCLAYLDNIETVLRNKRQMNHTDIFPELSQIHKQIKKKCILDGELIVLKGGVPDFSEIQRRSLMSNRFKIELAAKKLPASFIAFDILYYDDNQITDLPLIERKKILAGNIKENDRLAISRYIEENGTDLYQLTEDKNLEGIVAKPIDSKYYPGERSKTWIKSKNLQDDDFVVCGYIQKSEHVTSIVLGQYRGNELVYKGHVTLGLSNSNFQKIHKVPTRKTPAIKYVPSGSGNDRAIWIRPELVCTVKYMEKTSGGGLRQPVFKGIRSDKLPKECIE